MTTATPARSMLTPLPRAVLLDLDDTILDDTGPVDSCWDEACQDCCLDADLPHTLAEIKSVRDWYWSDADRHRAGRLDMSTARRLIVATAFQRVGREDKDLAVRIADRYSELRDLKLTVCPGAIETLTWLRASGCRLALLTNGSRTAQRAKVARFELEALFDSILIEGELGFGKPDLRVFRQALRDLNALPKDTCMVGDNLEWDIAPAQELGLRAVWVDSPGRGLPPSSTITPHRIVRRLSDLRDV